MADGKVTPPRVIGLILAGGEGRRMGYQNKGLVTLQDRPLVAHVIARIAPQVDQLYISVNQDLERYQPFNLPLIQDEETLVGQGPLAGIATLLPMLEPDDVLQVVSCDGPYIPQDLVARLSAAREMDTVVYPRTDERAHYLYLQGRVGKLREITSFLATGDLRIRALLTHLGARAILFDDEMAFVNCNSMQDIETVEGMLHEKL